MPEEIEVSTDPIELGEFRQLAHKLAVARRKALATYVKQAEATAIAEGSYQETRAKAFMRLKNMDGGNATSAGEMVKGESDVVLAQIERDKEAAILKGRLEEIAGIDAERASLHKLADWSMRAG